uniref:Elongator complex protein 4 n=1 Tax=Lynceus sp. MCZ IZ 141354 TaxID=1930659 RepID=A0A9N6WRE1_9CRUS|nr:EOG090X0ALT [Lynceus sp. MCZ IZ 141354]
MIDNLPTKTVFENQGDSKTNNDELRIAWRYKNMALTDTPEKKHAEFYDLSKSRVISETDRQRINVWDGQSLDENLSTNSNPLFQDLLQKMYQASQSLNPQNILRIVIHGFGSLLWMENDISLSGFLLALKAIVRSTNSVAIVTLSSSTPPVESERCYHLADMVMRLKSITNDKLNLDFHGILEIRKFARINSLRAFGGHDGQSRFGFKVNKKKFVIEKLHLPPDLGTDVDLLDSSSPTASSKSLHFADVKKGRFFQSNINESSKICHVSHSTCDVENSIDRRTVEL